MSDFLFIHYLSDHIIFFMLAFIYFSYIFLCAFWAFIICIY